jgi:hypothetical protein
MFAPFTDRDSAFSDVRNFILAKFICAQIGNIDIAGGHR